MINDAQKAEFIAAETLLMEQISRAFPPAKLFILNSKAIQDKIDAAEDMLLACMRENGMINGELAGEMLAQKYPAVCAWINIPKSDFRLVDQLHTISTILFGGI